MPAPKFRLFAGPNGSGKTFVFKRFKRKKIIHTEIYVNADRIEEGIRKKGKFFFNSYHAKVQEEEFKNTSANQGFSLKKSRIKHSAITYLNNPI